jgi:hypothetical protein
MKLDMLGEALEAYFESSSLNRITAFKIETLII